MDRLVKLMEHRNSNSSPPQSHLIFDVQTFQSQLQRTNLFNESKYKRMSFSEYSCTTQQKQVGFKGNQLLLKSEIKPHEQSKNAALTEIIKKKIKQARRGDKKNEKDALTQSSYKEKKNMQSAYIAARKRIFHKQSSIGANSTTDFDYSQQNKNKFRPYQGEPNDLLLRSSQFQAPSAALFSDKGKQGTNPRISQRRKNIHYLEKIITDKNIGEYNQSEFNMRSSRFNSSKKSSVVIRKRNNIEVSSNSPLRKAKSFFMDSDQNPLEICLKNFEFQNNIDEENINLFPQNTSPPEIKKSRLLPWQYNNQITSRFVAIMHVKEDQVVSFCSLNHKERTEIASLTKIMTCYLILLLAQLFNLDLKKQKIMAGQRAAHMRGTSARLAYSDICTVYEMLHGLMLPSGNDAAVALGQWGGKIIRRYSALMRRQRYPESSEKPQNFITNITIKRKSTLRLFIHHMNKLANHLGLKNTHFANTHGLMNEKAYSCALDVAMLTKFTMQHSTFRQIVGKTSFSCKMYNRTFGHTKSITWENTNKLLGLKGFIGVKTGVTPSAGPCLSTRFQVSPGEYFVTVVLRTKSCEMRFRQTVLLLKRILQKLDDESTCSHQDALIELDNYERLNVVGGDDSELLNDCQESSTSNSDKEDADEIDACY